jgi:hypothetical protein
MSRLISDQIIERSRSIWRMAEDQERSVIRSALLDVTIDAAMELAYKSMQLIDQYASVGPSRQQRVMRDLLTLWRKLVRNVKAVNSDHPIGEHHLYLVLLDSWGIRMNAYEKLFPTCSDVKLLYHQRFGLCQPLAGLAVDAKRKTLARARVREILDAYAGNA